MNHELKQFDFKPAFHTVNVPGGTLFYRPATLADVQKLERESVFETTLHKDGRRTTAVKDAAAKRAFHDALLVGVAGYDLANPIFADETLAHLICESKGLSDPLCEVPLLQDTAAAIPYSHKRAALEALYEAYFEIEGDVVSLRNPQVRVRMEVEGFEPVIFILRSPTESDALKYESCMVNADLPGRRERVLRIQFLPERYAALFDEMLLGVDGFGISAALVDPIIKRKVIEKLFESQEAELGK